MGQMDIKSNFCTSGKKVTLVIAVAFFIIWYWWPSTQTSISGPKWQMYPRLWFNAAKKPNNAWSFTVLSNNILAAKYIHPGEYTYASKAVLNKKYRHSHLMIEITTQNPDIVNMQEVEQPYYDELLSPNMLSLGYMGVANIDKRVHSGQATFWKKNKFKLLEHQLHRFTDLAEPYIKNSKILKESEKNELITWLQKPYCMIAAHLQDIKSNDKILVGNAHFIWDSLGSPAIQTLQGAVALQILSALSKKTGTKAIVFTGDLNTPPTYPAYSMIQRGKLDDSIIKNILGKTAKVYNNHYVRRLHEIIPDAYNHDLLVESAYYKAMGKEPEFTNADFVAVVNGEEVIEPMCLDYIWFSNQTLSMSKVLQLPDKNAVLKYVGLPSMLFPSDHLPLIAEFYVK